ncbi:uncharacterized protein LOC113225911 [Hyposmocoma kahamanoa]|uniref:uncharacterized protein LOC113225911 n=1 Tax=Hyposmocoma kahamanoa TaxID=1477025 RepID=UPI000E6D983E|nr:uncharacterized protein LOC113225911 [Hyposmocoma kahamanoa]
MVGNGILTPVTTSYWATPIVPVITKDGTISVSMCLDSTTKWLEIFKMQRTTADAVIKVLRETFARFSLPMEVVSDNGPPFTSREYGDFMTTNGIKVTFTAAYHSSSNDAAENAVNLCKRAIKKSRRDGCDVDAALQAYLMLYRNVEHCSTGASPAMLLQLRSLKSRLDWLREDRQVEARVQDAQRKQVSHAGGSPRNFNVGDTVWARDFTGRRWESGPPVKRHVDQIRKRHSSYGVTLAEEVDISPDEVISTRDSIPGSDTVEVSATEEPRVSPRSVAPEPGDTICTDAHKELPQTSTALNKEVVSSSPMNPVSKTS